MKDLRTLPLASRADITLSLGNLLSGLHQRLRLLRLVREAFVERLVLRHAANAGLSVSAAELQQAADDFRRQHGLAAADQRHAWLVREQLSILDFEAGLERTLHFSRFRDHLTRDRALAHFTEHRDRYGRCRFRVTVAPSEGAAREMLHQVQDEGRDFAAVARRHPSHPPARGAPGDLMRAHRYQLPTAVADLVFAARAGDLVGPVAVENGFWLVLVEDVSAPELDAFTADAVRHHLFNTWLREQLAGLRIDLSWLEVADGSA